MNILVIGCGSYMDAGYGCPGEYKCINAVKEKNGTFAEYDDPVIVGFLRCQCPGRATINNIGMVKKNVQVDAIHLSNCMVKAQPMCKNHDFDKFKEMVEEKFGVPCILGTHAYD